MLAATYYVLSVPLCTNTIVQIGVHLSLETEFWIQHHPKKRAFFVSRTCVDNKWVVSSINEANVKPLFLAEMMWLTLIR